jgi:hypothetical protein
VALDSAFVDRARIIRQEAASAVRVAGSTVMAEVETEWFDAMLQMPSGAASTEPSGGRRRVVKVPTLLYDIEDHAGEPVEIRLGDKIEVESDRFGTAYWEPTGEAEPLATLQEILGFQVTLQRVVDRTFRPVNT